jgi:hypothetical protein
MGESRTINGAQGVVVDVMLQSQDELPEYILINFDIYKGPRIYLDEDKKTWVPIIKMTKQHHLNQSIYKNIGSYQTKLSNDWT